MEDVSSGGEAVVTMNRPLLIELPQEELPEEIDLTDLIDARGVRYLGKATRQSPGVYCCIADVGGALCVVEVTVKHLFAAMEWRKSG